MWQGNRCWVCGPDQPDGLHVEWQLGRPVTARLCVPARYEGFDGVAHGGTVAAIADDGMWYAVWQETGWETATVELSVRYRRPVPIDAPLIVTATAEPPRHRVVRATAQVCAEDGALLAEAQGRFMPGAAIHSTRRSP